MNTLTQRLVTSGSDLFRKIVYKRIYLAYAQIKFTVEKKQQILEDHRDELLLKIAKNLILSQIKAKKSVLKKWQSVVRSQNPTNILTLSILNPNYSGTTQDTTERIATLSDKPHSSNLYHISKKTNSDSTQENLQGRNTARTSYQSCLEPNYSIL